MTNAASEIATDTDCVAMEVNDNTHFVAVQYHSRWDGKTKVVIHVESNDVILTTANGP